jgi:hypothetical protein
MHLIVSLFFNFRGFEQLELLPRLSQSFSVQMAFAFYDGKRRVIFEVRKWCRWQINFTLAGLAVEILPRAFAAVFAVVASVPRCCSYFYLISKARRMAPFRTHVGGNDGSRTCRCSGDNAHETRSFEVHRHLLDGFMFSWRIAQPLDF